MKIAAYLFIGLGILDILLSLMGVDITGFEESALAFIVIGVFLLFLEKQKGKAAEFEGSLDEGETLLKSGTVSVKVSLMKAENGSLFLTNRRLLYTGRGRSDSGGLMQKIANNLMSVGKDVGRNNFELLLGDISSVETKFPNYIIIKDKDNNEFKLIPFGKKKWKDEILKAVSGTD